MTPDVADTYDVVVIGSGPAGAAYARQVSDRRPGTRILIVEVGPVVSQPPGDHVKNIADPARLSQAQVASQGPAAFVYPPSTLADRAAAADGGPIGALARAGTFLLGSGSRVAGEDGMPAAAMSSNVGGMGAHWTCACPRPGGAERTDVVPGGDLDTALGRAEQLLGVTTTAFSGAPYGERVRELLGAAFDPAREPARRVQAMPLAVRTDPDGRLHWAGPQVILGDLLDRPEVTLVADTLCRRIVMDGDRATGVELEHRPSGGTRTVSARYVVAACDALRTPQLLFASGIRPAALGRYLNDQPQIFAVVRLGPAGEDATGRPDSPPSSGESPEGAIDPLSGVSWVPYADEEPYHGQVMQLDASPVPLPEDAVVEPGSIVGLGWFCAKDLQPEDRVELSEGEVDSYGMPAMTLHYRLTGRDRVAIAGATAAVHRAASALGAFLPDQEPTLLPSGSSLHYQGTTRMGLDPATSVCGADSVVWGTTNVYVAGNGVIPTATACNPTLTAVALAVLGANHLAQRLSAEG